MKWFLHSLGQEGRWGFCEQLTSFPMTPVACAGIACSNHNKKDRTVSDEPLSYAYADPVILAL
jgi:hypothetical protein